MRKAGKGAGGRGRCHGALGKTGARGCPRGSEGSGDVRPASADPAVARFGASLRAAGISLQTFNFRFVAYPEISEQVFQPSGAKASKRKIHARVKVCRRGTEHVCCV